MKKTLLILCFLIALNTKGQEFNFTVAVNTQQIQGTDLQMFQTLQTAIEEFINSRNWTNFNFKPEERIEGTLMITLDERISSDEFKGQLNIVLRRPVFNTNYNTVLLNYLDRDFHIRYIEHQPLEYSDGSFTSNLTSILAFYIYISLGLDADSFARFEGNPFFERAMEVVNSAQNAAEKGWRSFESQRNRYWLIENLLNGAYMPLRESIYLYHRRGLDLMSENMDMGRLAVTESIEKLQAVHRTRPGLFILQLFLEAKRDEIINIYSRASQMDKPRIVNILKEIDPANSSTYQRILSGS